MNQPRQEKPEDIVLFGEPSADPPCRDHVDRIYGDSVLTCYDPQPIHGEAPTIDDEISIAEVEIRERLIEWLVGFLPGGPRADLESVSPQGGTGSTTLVTSIAIAVLLGALALAQPGAYSQDDPANPTRKTVQSRPRGRGARRNDPGNVPRRALEAFRKEVPEISAARKAPGKPPAVTGSSSHWECTDGETILTVDLRGNASYRKVPGWTPDPPDESGSPGRPPRSGPDEARLVQRTRRLASLWLPAERLDSLKPAAKRETLLLAKLPGGAISEMRGRTIVRLLGQDGGFFQAVFDPESALLRVDLAVADAPTMDLCDLAILARLSAKGKPAIKTPLNLGCFFDPGEYRFEINAFAVEGEPFLDLYQELNPFGRDEFDLKAPHRVSVRDYRDSQDYRSWCWTWWERYGRVGAFRGNYLERRGRVGWEYPQHRLVQHRSLGAYRLVEGEPRQTKVIQQSDGPVKYPHAVGRHLDASFYRDLEQCHVAFVFTHGGPIDGVYQVQRGLDVWVVLLPAARKLGVGNLRHLFLDGCAAFTFRREPQGAHLVKTWIEQAPADGVRTVCGIDGNATGLDRDGWRYFGYYNKGESVSDSWAFGYLDEYIENCPVTAAYGSTTREALGSLLTGRFTDQRAEAKAVAISVWAGLAVPAPAESSVAP